MFEIYIRGILGERYEKSCRYDKVRIDYIVVWRCKLKVERNLIISIDLSFI